MKVYVIGIGPGGKERMTYEAVAAIKDSDKIVGYKPYIEYIEDYIGDKEVFVTGMTGEIERCKKAIEFAKNGFNTAIISTGDAGLYGMAGPILELAEGEDIEVEIIPGVSAVFSAASELGAPLMMDTAIISLSDLMVPYEMIKKRVELASEGDFVIALYNPRSKGRPDYLKECVEIIRKYRDDDTPVGLVKNSGRTGKEVTRTKLAEIDYEKVDMMTIVIIGNKASKFIGKKMVTPRGYEIK